VQQRRQQSPVCGREAHLLPAQLALQHRDLMAQDQDLGVLRPITGKKKVQDRERVHHRQVGQPQDGASQATDPAAKPQLTPRDRVSERDRV
jgi:hypothetical protein